MGIAGGVAWTVVTIWNVDAEPAPPAMSLAVAPLVAPSDDAEVSRLAAVLTQNIATRLSREGGWASEPRARVVFVHAAAASGGRTASASELGRTVNVRYVLEGDLLESGDHFAMNLRLVDAATLGQVWSQREAWQEAEIAAESSAKLRNLTSQLRSALQGAETRRVVDQPVSDLDAMELVLRAIHLWRNDISLAGTIKARELADEALRREPELVPALLIGGALAERELDLDPDASHRDRILREYDEFTNRAVSLDPTDPVAWDFRAIVLMYLGRWDAALEANATAIKLAPDKPDHYDSRAWLMNMTGHPDEALPLVDRALAMDPHSTEMGFGLRNRCEAYLLLGQAEQAIAACERARGLSKDDLFLALFLAAAYANHGDLAKAAIARADVLRIAPGYTIAQLRAKRYSEHPQYQRMAREHWHEGLRKAGFPEQ
jgi:TolB-like protein/Tfp pilus assembly protein PilF